MKKTIKIIPSDFLTEVSLLYNEEVGVYAKLTMVLHLEEKIPIDRVWGIFGKEWVEFSEILRKKFIEKDGFVTLKNQIQPKYKKTENSVSVFNEIENSEIQNNCIDVIVLYNENCTSNPSVKKITKARENAIKKLLKEYNPEQIKEVFLKVKNNAFLTGNNERGWTADFDWIINPDNFLKITENKYEPKQGSVKNNTNATDAQHRQSAVDSVNKLFGLQ